MNQLAGVVELEAVPLGELLELLANVRANGSLRISDAQATGELIVANGCVVAASFGSERGREAVEAIVLALPHGRFSFTSGASAAVQDISLSTEEFTAELARLDAERNVVFAKIPSLAATPRTTEVDRIQTTAAVVLAPSAIQALLMIDGHRTVAQLGTERGLGKTVRDLVALVEAGLVQFDPVPSVATRRVAHSPLSRLARRILGIFVRLEDEVVPSSGQRRSTTTPASDSSAAVPALDHAPSAERSTTSHPARAAVGQHGRLAEGYLRDIPPVYAASPPAEATAGLHGRLSGDYARVPEAAPPTTFRVSHSSS